MHPAIALHGHIVYTGQDYRLNCAVWKCTILPGVNEAQFTHEYAGMYMRLINPSLQTYV